MSVKTSYDIFKKEGFVLWNFQDDNFLKHV